MLKGMTGFAKAEGRIKGGILQIEIKSFNHRFLEVVTRLPPEFLTYEEEIKRLLREKIRRGSLNVLFLYSPRASSLKRVHWDERLVKRYFQMVKILSQKFGLKNGLTVNQLFSLPGVLVYEEKNIDLSGEWKKCKKILERAIEKLIKVKEREGRTLLNDIFHNLRFIEVSLKKIEQRSKQRAKEFQKRFQKKFKDLTQEKIAQEKLLEETSLFLRNTDISEETVRVRSHLKDINTLLRKEEEVGRKLDFIAQEIFREVNTMGAKANDYFTSREVVLIKSFLEKIREQVQNLE
ncbi:MAG: YicC family protein [Candidatus Omnitrophica bacterium]|nr:YicC family protein [Candidatus Omnitrophota bacterium]MCM8798332.1 YicC family protein [Candidatus Omnitrophota bacterium]